jgi:Cyclopropane fatty acid synthase and related methyltransferases
MLLKVIRKGTPLWLLVFCLSTVVFAQRYKPEFQNRLAPFVSSPQRAVEKMLEMASLKPDETLYDLGCGDGRILITAAKRYHVKAVGIEISDRLARTAEDNVKSLGLEDQVKIIHGDFMQTDLSAADVVTLYLMTAANEKVRPDLEKYLKKDARVVSYDYPIPGWTPVDQAETEPSRYGNRHTIYLYQVPTSFKK